MNTNGILILLICAEKYICVKAFQISRTFLTCIRNLFLVSCGDEKSELVKSVTNLQMGTEMGTNLG